MQLLRYFKNKWNFSLIHLLLTAVITSHPKVKEKEKTFSFEKKIPGIGTNKYSYDQYLGATNEQNYIILEKMLKE